MAAKRILFGMHGAARVLEGAKLLAAAVQPTLGPGGRNVLLERPLHSAPLATKDGVTVAEEIELFDRFANMGANLVLEGAARTSFAAGDGTTTAIVLAHALCREGAKLTAAGHHSSDLKRGVDRAVEQVKKALARMAKPVTGKRDVARVATLSANGDATLGDLVARAVGEVGTEGVIHVLAGNALETKLEIAEGTQIDHGYLSPYFITDPGRIEAVLEEPLILLYEEKIVSVAEILPVLEKATAAGRSLLIVAEVTGEALTTVVVNKVKGTLKACIVQPPSYGKWRKDMLADLAAQTGGHALLNEPGAVRLSDMTIDDFGRAERVVVDQEKTVIIGGTGRKAEIDARARMIRAEYENTNSAFDHQRLEERLRKLVGGAAIIRVGGTTQPEIRERKLRLDDALFATRAALEEGVVPGGGVALLRASNGLTALARRVPSAQAAGVELVLRACEEPLKRIVKNVGQSGDNVLAKVKAETGAFGYDARKNRFGDLMKAGVMDPCKVVRLALEHAASVAMLILTSGAFIIDAPRTPIAVPVRGSSHDALSLDPFLSQR